MFNNEDFKNNLKASFDPNISKEDTSQLLEYFLKYKSIVTTQAEPYPRSVDEAINHLKDRVSSSETSINTSWQDSIPKYLIVGVLIAVISFLVISILQSYI